MRHRVRYAVYTLGLALVLSAGFSPTGTFGQELKKVTIGFPAFSGGFLPFFIAQEERYYRQEGLEVQIISVRGAVGIRALLAGNLDYNTAPSLDAIVRTKQPIRYIITMTRGKYTLVSNPAFAKTIAELKGKTLGVSAFGGSADLVSRRILKKHGLQPDKDVALLQVGNPSERLVALTAGRFAATLLTAPTDLQAQDQGMVVLENFIDNYPQIGVNTMQSHIDSKPDEVHRFVKATLKGLRYQVERKEDAVTKMMKFLKLKERDFARRVYAGHEDVMVPDGILPDNEKKEALETTQEAANVKGEIRIDQAFDDRFVKRAWEEIKKEGWKP